MKINSLSIKIILFLIFICSLSIRAQIYLDTTKSIDVRVEDLLSKMTLAEKIGQMTQAERLALQSITDIKTYALGSLLSGGGSAPSNNTPTGWMDMYDAFQVQAINSRLKIPILYGIDAVHGNNNVKNAVIFPHNIGLGCSRNPELIRRVADITAKEVIGTGLNWTFAPCIAVVRNERWGRSYEGFGETPELVTQMGVASVLGIQGDSLWGKSSILACAKHFLGDGGTTNGIDQGNTEMDEQTLRRLHLPAYIEAIKAGVGSIMASYSSWNGSKMHGHKYLLTDVLKNEIGFKGFVVSDWAAIDQLPGTYANQVESSINAGVDMIMLPYNYQEFITTAMNLVNQGKISQARIDDAVRRILRIKFQMGLFEKPFAERSYASLVGSAAHRLVARESVRQSLVLLKKKDNVLPLLKDGMNIHVAGKNADDLGNQCGGWTISWQGSSGNITQGTTIFSAISKAVRTSTVTYSKDGSGALGNDIAIAVIGETPYAEGKGDRTDLSLTLEDIATVRNMKSLGIPVVVILISGRPMILDPILHYADAIIAAWLPGTEGEGVADILFGDYQPSGLLSNSWPKSMAQIPINYMDNNYAPLWEYGFGITSLQNSVVGSAPVLTSASTNFDGTSVELTFNKPMMNPSSFLSAFSVMASSVNLSLTKAELNTEDKTTIVLTLAQGVKRGDVVLVNYSPGGVQSQDGGSLGALNNRSVYNMLNELKIFSVPCKIEAEDYNAMFGLQTESTSDLGGGLNIGWTDANDWLDYYLNVPATGEYKINLRVAAESQQGQIALKTGGTILSILDLPVTSGWQTWRTVSTTCSLSQGNKYLRLHVNKGGFNLNWLEITSTTLSVKDNSVVEDFKLYQNYPNPFNPTTSIKYDIAEACIVKLSVYDILGNEVALLVNEEQSSGSYSIKFNAGDFNLSSGIYFYKLQAGKYSESKKLSLIK